ncbi:MAG: AraC family transcriptional regulator [Tannerellaceae bacterium]
MSYLKTHRLVLNLEKIGIQIFDIFGRYNYVTTQKQLPTHIHPDMIEICYLAKGCQSYIVGNQTYVIYGGDVFITFPNEEHGTGDAPEEKGVLYWMVLKRPKLTENYIGLSYEEASALFNKLSDLPNRVFKGGSRCEQILRKVFHLYFEPISIIRNIEINNLLVSLFLHLIHSSEYSAKRISDERIEIVLEYIHTNITENLDLNYLSQLCNLSISRFKHLFKAEVGIPPSEYIIRKKIALSMQMILDGNSIKNVAYDLGFSSSSHFSTVFKQYQGYSPRQLKTT